MGENNGIALNNQTPTLLMAYSTTGLGPIALQHPSTPADRHSNPASLQIQKHDQESKICTQHDSSQSFC
jgi:hypothetical protein